MKINNVLLVGLTALIALGCEVKGGFTANEDITVKDKRGRSVDILAGTYKAQVKSKISGGKLKLKVKINGKTKKIYFKVAKGTKLPRRNGVIKANAADAMQNHDLVVNVDSVNTGSNTYESSESCVMGSSWEYVCEVVHTKTIRGRPHYEEICSYENVIDYGHQAVQITDNYYKTTYEINLLVPKTERVVAGFDATETGTDSYSRSLEACHY